GSHESPKRAVLLALDDLPAARDPLLGCAAIVIPSLRRLAGESLLGDSGKLFRLHRGWGSLRPATTACIRATIAAMVGPCDIAGAGARRELLFARLHRAACGCLGCGSGESIVRGDSGDPGFRPLWRFVECREDRRLGNRAIVALSLHGNRPGFWRYSCVVASSVAGSRVPHVRVSLYAAKVHPGALSRQFLQPPVRHDVFSIC